MKNYNFSPKVTVFSKKFQEVNILAVPIINTSCWCCFLDSFCAFFPRSPRCEHERDRSSLSEVHSCI